MTSEHKIVIAAALLPVLADFLEDIPMMYQPKQLRDGVVNRIRCFDKMLLKDTDSAMHEEQVNIQIAFRQWCEESFK